MIEINLLPWREEQIRVKNRLFILMAVIIILFCSALCFLFNAYIQSKIKHETQEVQLLAREIHMLESKIKQIKGFQEKQQSLLAKREIIQTLQVSRIFMVQLFEDIAKSVPEEIQLLVISRKDYKLVLEGASDTNNQISVFMRNLEQLPWLTNATLQEIKTASASSSANYQAQDKQIIFKLQGDINY